jgi:hypothetical protein
MIVNDGYAKVSMRQILDEVHTSASGAGKAWITKYSFILGGQAKAAIRGHLKTGHRRSLRH